MWLAPTPEIIDSTADTKTMTLTNTFRAFIASSIAATTLLAGGTAKAETKAEYIRRLSQETYTYNIDVKAGYDLYADGEHEFTNVSECPAGKSKRHHIATNGTRTELGCVTEAEATLWFEQYKAALNGQRRPVYSSGQFCTGLSGGYGQFFASCF